MTPHKRIISWHRHDYFIEVPMTNNSEPLKQLWNISNRTNFILKTAYDSPCIQASRTIFFNQNGMATSKKFPISYVQNFLKNAP